MARCIPRGLGAAAVMAMLVVWCTPVAEGREPPRTAVIQFKGLCYYNGTQRPRAVDLYIHNREEFVRFDSDVGEFVAKTEFGRRTAEYFNSQKDYLDQERAAPDTVCRHNYEMDSPLAASQHAKPNVDVYLSRTEVLNQHNMLVCSVTDFYPGQVKVRWFRNDQEETEGVVSSQLIRNGDWTFQILVMLEMTPQRGDVYICHVEHPTLQTPVTVEWRTQSDSSQGKMVSGIGGFVLGSIFLGLGLFIRHKNKKGPNGPLPAGLLN